jgi:uncharacterized protein YgiM (DUF1202 family)
MKRFAILLTLVVLAMTVTSAYAMTRDGADWTVDCAGFISNGGGFLVDRDNTSTGREKFIITAVDGNGNVIFGPITESFRVGGRVGFEDGVRFNWSRTPAANPLTVRVVSTAGNGLVTQAVYAVSGDCASLSSVVPPVLNQPNVSAPVQNPADATQQPGSIVVDTFRINVRSGDGAQYTVIGQLNGGQHAAVLGTNAARTWWYIQAGEVRGWVRGDTELIVFRGDLRNTPTLVAQGEIFPPRLYVFSRANVYVSPSTASAVICEVAGNAEYVIDSVSADGEWFVIHANCGGQTVLGWIFGENGAVRNSGDLAIPVYGN